jgi:hypothetical protein
MSYPDNQYDNRYSGGDSLYDQEYRHQQAPHQYNNYPEYDYPAQPEPAFERGAANHQVGHVVHQDPSPNHYGNIDTFDKDYFSDRQSNRRVCCFRSIKHMICCLLILLIILAGIGVALYFLFKVPRIEDVTVNYRQQLGADDPSVEIDPNSNPLSIALNLNVSAMVVSESLIPYKVDKVYVDVFTKTSGPNRQVATGITPSSVTIPVKSKTRVFLPTTVTLKGQTNDPLIQSVLQACGIGGTRSKIPLRYVVRIDALGFLKSIKVAESDFALDCPQTITDGLNQVLGKKA